MHTYICVRVIPTQDDIYVRHLLWDTMMGWGLKIDIAVCSVSIPTVKKLNK